MAKGDPTISSVILTERAGMALRGVLFLNRRVQLLTIASEGSMVIPVFLGEHSKGIPFLNMYKK